MITKEQVADLQPGDVVELSNRNWHGAVVKGPVHNMDTGYLCVGEYAIARPDGEPFSGDRDLNLSVVSRAPRPLYVNHPRTEPTAGDVVQPADSCGVAFRTVTGWIWPNGTAACPGDHGLRLLVDGETGQVVQ